MRKNLIEWTHEKQGTALDGLVTVAIINAAPRYAPGKCFHVLIFGKDVTRNAPYNDFSTLDDAKQGAENYLKLVAERHLKNDN
jgi:hypothetical protein